MTNWITRFNGRLESENQQTTVQISANVAKAAQELGFQELNYVPFDNLGEQPDRRRSLIETILRPVQPRDLVVVQFPLWEQLDFQAEFIDYLKRIKQIKVIALVHEVPTWLYADDGDRSVIKNDFWFTQLRKFDLLVVANEKQARRLVKDEIDIPMVSLQLWDYPYAGPLQEKQFRKQLHYISDQAVTALDYRGSTPIMFYNTEVDEKVANNPSVKHIVGLARDNLIAELADGFGLVNTVNITEATNPNVVRNSQYNDPIELSMYLAAGMPVVVPDSSAHAQLVKQHHLGLVIHDLNEIDEALSHMTIADYQEMVAAIEPWQKAVSTRYFVKRALMAGMRKVNLGFDNFLI